MQTFDAEKALEQMEGDKEGLELLFSTFVRVSATQFDEFREAIERADAESLASLAHRFCGSLGLFAATRAIELTREIEAQARNLDFSGAKETLANLEAECSKLNDDLEAFFQLDQY